MLGLTRAAAQAIRELMEAHEAGGVRIHAGSKRFARGGAPAIQIEAAPWPDVDDTVLEIEGAWLYVDSQTQRVLDDKVLDADLSGDEPRFTVLKQPEGAPILEDRFESS
jgi:Fe-S cluster assembly iron-binding protein IscA